MSKVDEIREQVSHSYAKAVTSAGCSGGTCPVDDPKGVTAKYAGYSPDELARLPQAAAGNSFGCGNPLSFVGVKPGDVVLDLGSGAGLDLLIAAARVGPEGRVIGVDMTDEMIQVARGNIAQAGLKNVEVRNGIIEQLPVEDGSVDWVISNCVINLSPEKGRVFQEIHRVLKPGGQISVSDIVVEELPDWARELPELYNGCIGGAISEEDYLEGLRRAGLAEVAVRDRLVYSADQLRQFAGSLEGGSGCFGGAEVMEQLIAGAAGKVWSAQFHGRRP